MVAVAVALGPGRGYRETQQQQRQAASVLATAGLDPAWTSSHWRQPRCSGHRAEKNAALRTAKDGNQPLQRIQQQKQQKGNADGLFCVFDCCFPKPVAFFVQMWAAVSLTNQLQLSMESLSLELDTARLKDGSGSAWFCWEWRLS